MKIIYSLIIISVLFSCNKVLDTTPNGNLTESQFYQNETQITNALSGCYTPLYPGGNAMYGLFYQAVLTMQADEFFNRNDVTGAYTLIVNAHDYSNAQIADFWNYCYSGIERVNVLLDNIARSKATVDSTTYNAIMGEALFLRGYYHFLLVQNFGGVPIKIERTASTSDVNRRKNTVREVYDQILSDMTTAEGLVYPTYSQFSNYTSRVTKTVVEGILARVCLYMAGYPLNDNSMYAESLKWSDKVIASGIHVLNTGYDINPLNIRGTTSDSLRYSTNNGNPGYINNPFSQVFLYEAKGTNYPQENMWETNPIPNTAYAKNTNIGGQYGGPQCGSNYDVLGRVSNQALTTQVLYMAYATGDLRRDWTCAPYSWSSATQPVKTFTSTSSVTNGNLNARPIAKWRREYEPFSTGYTVKSSWGTGIRFPFLRYADILLMNSEAELYVNGATTKAYDGINQVRRRAFAIVNGTSPIKTITLSSKGTGYTSAPTVTITGTGTGASAVASISSGTVSAITITNAGIGYGAGTTVTISGGGGSGAVAVANLWSTSDVDLPSNMSVTVFMDSLMKERFKEFAGEALRKPDLIRWNKYVSTMQSAANYFTANNVALLSGNTIKELRLFNTTISGGSKYLLFPIPSTEIQTNKLIEQNPGW